MHISFTCKTEHKITDNYGLGRRISVLFKNILNNMITHLRIYKEISLLIANISCNYLHNNGKTSLHCK